MGNILVIDDDRMLCSLLARHLSARGHRVACAYNLEAGLEAAGAALFDVIMLDVQLPDGNGLEAIPLLRDAAGKPEIIIFTSSGDPDGAELAIKSGAWDYIEKPSSLDQMTLPLSRALQYREEKSFKEKPVLFKREGIIGESPPLLECLEAAAQAALSEANVLLFGETGTGKELLARAVHNNSPRQQNNFVVVDCASLPASLVESALFGHEKGAFTGADRTQEGLIKQAHGGTLFLDEVGELPAEMQKSFLRVLQEHRFRPIGGRQEIFSSFRLVSATNQDLEALVSRGLFRQDLLFRLRTITIEMPPLRKRLPDIKDLFFYYLNQLTGKSGLGIKGYSPEFFEALQRYEWPGNIRELKTTLEAAIHAAGSEPILYPSHLPVYIRIWLAKKSIAQGETTKTRPPESPVPPLKLTPLKEFREENDERYLRDLFSLTGGDLQKMLTISGLSRSRLYTLLKKYAISS
ncbi:MAG: sigma-54-dependent Fis family transcriptional regulator [Deltaproteobacteria bacterium]|nr:sigma-54-dependent Fis family transcriptional regulator [Deltaproteobacteria bacterium]